MASSVTGLGLYVVVWCGVTGLQLQWYAAGLPVAEGIWNFCYGFSEGIAVRICSKFVRKGARREEDHRERYGSEVQQLGNRASYSFES